jgi:hypothetical protein
MPDNPFYPAFCSPKKIFTEYKSFDEASVMHLLDFGFSS